jgi:hypothetical protein
MCSQNCIREFEKFWQNSLQALLFAASRQSLASMPSLLPSTSSLSNSNCITSQIKSGSCLGNASYRRRRRRKRNKNRRFAPYLQRNSFIGAQNEPNVQMRLKSIVSVKETHQMAELNHDKNDKLKSALGISPFFIEGSSLDATRKAKEALAAEALLQQKKYQLIKDPSPEPQVEEHKIEAKGHEKRKRKEKSRKDKSNKRRRSRKHSSESESESDSDINESRTHHKKKKKINSHERKTKEKKRSKRRDHKKRKHSKYSDSSSGSDSNSESSSGSTSSSSNSSSDSDSVSESESSSSSNSSNYKSSRKDKHSIEMGHKYSSSPEITHKIRSQYNYKK